MPGGRQEVALKAPSNVGRVGTAGNRDRRDSRKLRPEARTRVPGRRRHGSGETFTRLVRPVIPLGRLISGWERCWERDGRLQTGSVPKTVGKVLLCSLRALHPDAGES